MSNLPTVINDDDFFGDTISNESFKPPRVKIIQPTSEDKGENGGDVGNFKFSSGRLVDELKGLVLVKPSQSRVLYGNKGASVICRSDNYFKPSNSIEQPLSESCQTCPYGDWGNEAMKMKVVNDNKLRCSNYNRPLCKASYDIVMADADRQPFLISFQGVARKAVEEKLLSTIKMWKKGVPKCSIEFDMKTVNKGEYFTVDFCNFREATDVEECIELYQGFSSIASQLFADDNQERENAQTEVTNHAPGAENTAPTVDTNDEIPF